MALFSRKRDKSPSRRDQAAARSATTQHFEQFVASRQGVEAFYEPQTPREPSALMLVARDGEWTRRRVPDAVAGAKLAQQLGIPFYEVVKTGYPDSVRQWNERQRRR
ncbi:MAG: oxidoreductase [Actinomycetaceae bacterium]|nr:oxidoreductase [Actinomycetaceae bacterium]